MVYLFMQTMYEEQLANGLRYQLVDGLLHRFYVTNTERQTVDALVEQAMAIDAAYAAAHQHACYLFILANAPFRFYILQKIAESMKFTPPTLIESAAIVGDSFTIRIFSSLLVNRLSNKARHSTQFFSDEAAARTWLLQRIEDMALAQTE